MFSWLSKRLKLKHGIEFPLNGLLVTKKAGDIFPTKQWMLSVSPKLHTPRTLGARAFLPSALFAHVYGWRIDSTKVASQPVHTPLRRTTSVVLDKNSTMLKMKWSFPGWNRLELQRQTGKFLNSASGLTHTGVFFLTALSGISEWALVTFSPFREQLC